MRFISVGAFFGLLLCSFTVAAGPSREKPELCRKPRCEWVNDLLRNGKLTRGGTLTDLEDEKAFCNDGVQPLSLEGLTQLWTTFRVTIKATPRDELVIGRGNSSEHALSGKAAPTQEKNGTCTLYLPPYHVECVGLISETGKRVHFQFVVSKTAAYEYLLLLAVGLTLFFAAPHLARSVTLFYGAGITIGVVASLLILLYMFGKFVPKKTSIVGLGILTGGYTLFASFFYWFWNHALEVALSNWQYVVAYVVAAALISFAVLYRMSPPSDVRSLNLIQWTIQLVAVAFVYLGCPLKELGVVGVITTLLLYNFSGCLLVVLSPLLFLSRVLGCLLAPFSCLLSPLSCLLAPLRRCLSLLFFPQPTRRLLTPQEYEEEGTVETKKALEELRKHCRQRNNEEIWEKISSLHDSKRFTSFLSGKGHISAQEQVDYEWIDGGMDSTSESESGYDNDDVPSHTPHSPSRSANSSRSSLSYSMNSSSDSPSFMHARPHSPHTPSTSTPHTRPHSRR